MANTKKASGVNSTDSATAVLHPYTDSLELTKVKNTIDQLQLDILKAVETKIPVESIGRESVLKGLRYSFNTKIDSVQQSIETSLNVKEPTELPLLKGWQSLLDGLLYAVYAGEITPEKIPLLLQYYQSTLDRMAGGYSILPVIKESDLSFGRIILKSIQPEKAIGLEESKDYVVLKTFEQEPAIFFRVLYDFPDVSCADSMLVIAARKLPEDLYTFSQAKNSLLGKRILHNTDSLIKLISYISSLPEGRQYSPFLDGLYHKKMSFATIKKTLSTGNRINYYKLLVNTQISYKERLSRKDTAIGYESIFNELNNIALNDFVYVINGLHEYPDKIRLKVLETLNARELYYICIAGVNDLYTSSYVKIYHKIISLQRDEGNYLFLQSIGFDYYKRFLKMASTFNTLDDFLSGMKKQEADSVMHAFVTGLNIATNFEDAVNVADSYASIKNDRLRSFILNEIKSKLTTDDHQDAGSKPGIYKMLYTLFLSLDTANHVDLSAVLGIPPVYRVDNKLLKDDLDRIIMQQFFYGDDDGKYSFDIFIRSYRNANWKISGNKYWIKCVSQNGAPVEIYANKPLDENTSQDLLAQQMLSNYLTKMNLHPAVFIHRGHSYHVKNSLKYLTAGSKIVFLGSCGGYTNLKQVFTISPLAHLITTKQEGTGTINQPMLTYLTDMLRKGKSLDWPEVWKVLTLRFKNNPRFDDYIPPHQNLGAILMMAYYRQQAVKTNN